MAVLKDSVEQQVEKRITPRIQNQEAQKLAIQMANNPNQKIISTAARMFLDNPDKSVRALATYLSQNGMPEDLEKRIADQIAEKKFVAEARAEAEAKAKAKEEADKKNLESDELFKSLLNIIENAESVEPIWCNMSKENNTDYFNRLKKGEKFKLVLSENDCFYFDFGLYHDTDFVSGIETGRIRVTHKSKNGSLMIPKDITEENHTEEFYVPASEYAQQKLKDAILKKFVEIEKQLRLHRAQAITALIGAKQQQGGR